MIGYLTTSVEGVVWRENQGGCLPLSPPHRLNRFSKDSALGLLNSQRVFFVRWEAAFDSVNESPWWHVIKDSPDSLEKLPKKTRYMIRKADKAYEAKPVTLQEIIDQGYEVYVKAYERYQTHEKMFSESEFSDALTALPDQTEWWGVFDRESDRLVAFSENYIEDRACFYVTMWIEPEAMAKFAGYLLFHNMELHYLQERAFQYISDGARSISHDTNIHDFLISKFNFRKAFARLNVVYTPWLGVAVAVAFPFRSLIKKVPFNSFKKASILLRQEEIRRQSAKVVS